MRYSVHTPGQEADTMARWVTLLRHAGASEGSGQGAAVGRCWPDDNQRLLLKVLFEPAEAARGSWQAWRGTNDPETMDVPSMRLIPQVHRRLRRLGIDDPWMPRFKGSYRKTWTSNQRMLLHSLPALAELNKASVPVLALKGLAITLQYLAGDFGLRSMFDLDLLVSMRRLNRAIDVLVDNGYRFNSGRSVQYLKQKIVPRENGREFIKQLGHVDLHWHMLHQDPSEFLDEWTWKGVRPAELRGHSLSVPSPAVLLLNVCLHGVKYCSIPSIVWAADALRIITVSGHDVDWAGLVEIAGRRRLVVPLLDSLSFLNTVIDGVVPAPVLEALRRAPVSSIEQLEYQAICSAPAARSEVMRAAMSYLVSLRQRHASPDPVAQLASHSAWALHARAERPKPALSRAFGVRSRW